MNRVKAVSNNNDWKIEVSALYANEDTIWVRDAVIHKIKT